MSSLAFFARVAQPKLTTDSSLTFTFSPRPLGDTCTQRYDTCICHLITGNNLDVQGDPPEDFVISPGGIVVLGTPIGRSYCRLEV